MSEDFGREFILQVDPSNRNKFSVIQLSATSSLSSPVYRPEFVWNLVFDESPAFGWIFYVRPISGERTFAWVCLSELDNFILVFEN